MKLEEVCEIIMGQSPPSKTYNDIGEGLPFFQGKADFGEIYPIPRVWCISPQKVAQSGDVLISVRAPVGPTNLAKEVCCIGRGLAALRPNSGLDKMWLLYYLRNAETEISSYGKGSAFTAITKKHLVELLLPLPPLDEQRRIVEMLETLMERVREARRLRAEARHDANRLMQVALDEVFSKNRDIKQDQKTVCDILIDKPQYGLSKKASSEAIGVPILRMGNIVEGNVSLDDLKYIDLSPEEEAKYSVHEGNILFNRTNSAELVGKSAVYEDSRKAVFASYLIRLKVDFSKALPRYVVFYINSPQGQKYLQSQQTRAIGQVNVNAKKLQAMPIPLPSLNEQHSIIAYLEQIRARVQALKRVQEVTEREFHRLEQAILGKAFRGEL
ncbi:MAG TPA: restriction endonuclease subunit S [Thermodesulfobacteriota bacterium]|nr:restriction endonuclease subunit S [Thermodesulfobacteriota bacterium]